MSCAVCVCLDADSKMVYLHIPGRFYAYLHRTLLKNPMKEKKSLTFSNGFLHSVLTIPHSSPYLEDNKTRKKHRNEKQLGK